MEMEAKELSTLPAESPRPAQPRGFSGLGPFRSRRFAPGEYFVESPSGAVCFRVEGAAFAEWVARAMTEYDECPVSHELQPNPLLSGAISNTSLLVEPQSEIEFLKDGYRAAHAELDNAGVKRESVLWEGGPIQHVTEYPVCDRIKFLANDRNRLKKVVGCVVRTLRHLSHDRIQGEPGPLDCDLLWGRVSYVCGIGSTSAIELCREFECDPFNVTERETETDQD